jgi:HD-GYP domain-containing protein (c-di-GMP phosphodiesterase class II)
VAKAVQQHHESWNGSGYPSGLSGEDIIMEARILAVAEVVEAMVSPAPYGKALAIEKAADELNKGKGILYDPTVVDACLKLLMAGGFKFS